MWWNYSLDLGIFGKAESSELQLMTIFILGIDYRWSTTRIVMGPLPFIMYAMHGSYVCFDFVGLAKDFME